MKIGIDIDDTTFLTVKSMLKYRYIWIGFMLYVMIYKF